MTSPYPPRRRSGSDYSRTPGRVPPSPGYASSELSTSTISERQNPVVAAARSFTGMFAACFAPPESDNSRSLGDSEEFKSSSTASNGSRAGSRAGSQRGRNSNGGMNISSYNIVQRKEPGIVKFTMEEIFQVTRNFSPSFKIGQGGFGAVYKAKLLDGTVVAVKRAKKSLYEKHLGVEFQSEIQTLSKVEHLNLVKLYGYLDQGDERIIVVEYVPNGTLREHLDCIHGSVLDLAARLDVAIDVAHAITYLHMYIDHPIIHRDIKSSNILLTENFRAKVADFGFARQAADSDSGMTHVSTQVKGTAGYLDPEYLKTYQLTEKSDVYSFGVLLVELVTGRRPIEPKFELKERITAKWAMKRFMEDDAISVLDPRLDQTAANTLALHKILELALQCLAPRRQNRPSMKRCAEILWSIRKDFREQLSASNFRSFSTSSQRSSSLRE
ncbi:calmodulin-binding receptor-like cytoplasmic kinase 2 isoform X1 [Vigna radiata var. radiata]|uniref:non-specific serine/threonine protein kinase n=1 Tax=Vigna radiata var. radiata TaxID=3916 RepID=A0A1S3VAI6_VIGRR|nr:calmodulin-binding receptor-like cytoplasmic kinase 2 isoform X1 [Vigna radiata var. radiata]